MCPPGPGGHEGAFAYWKDDQSLDTPSIVPTLIYSMSGGPSKADWSGVGQGGESGAVRPRVRRGEGGQRGSESPGEAGTEGQ